MKNSIRFCIISVYALLGSSVLCMEGEKPQRSRARKPKKSLAKQVIIREAHKATNPETVATDNKKIDLQEKKPLKVQIQQDFVNAIHTHYDTSLQNGLTQKTISDLNKEDQCTKIVEFKKKHVEFATRQFDLNQQLFKILDDNACREITLYFHAYAIRKINTMVTDYKGSGDKAQEVMLLMAQNDFFTYQAIVLAQEEIIKKYSTK